jgi:uracil-DNA glycosylase family 4
LPLFGTAYNYSRKVLDTRKLMIKQQNLDALEAQIVADKVCPALAETAKQLVFGAGNPDADLFFVGEAPGKNEDIKGLPFVGAAGKFLDEMLESTGINRADVYITSILKYRPPNNRDPLPEEKKDFWPYLLAQIAIIQPKVVVTLGRHSGEAFIPDLVISRDHGVSRNVDLVLENIETEVTVLPLYHPAAALYNGSLRQTLINDFKQVKQLITK